MTASIVSDWFGPHFKQLHPLLQALHLNGGTLTGNVDVEFGKGLIGIVGRSLAMRLGLPHTPGTHLLEVDIRHDASALKWSRRFDNRSTMTSYFCPVGRWPTGHWIETTGPIRVELAVDVIGGGWHWRCKKLAVFGVRFPQFLFLKTTAFKRIEDNRYCFFVGFSLPVFGPLLTYSGSLSSTAQSP